MPKPKKQQSTSQNLTEALNNYDSKSLLAALNSFEGSLGWEVFKSFIYYQAATHGTMSNSMVQESGKQMEACAAGAKAEVLREVIDQFMDLLKSKVKGFDGVVTQDIPQD